MLLSLICSDTKNENEAVQQLLESVKAQISFCPSVNNPALFPAPREYLERWETAHLASPTNEKALVLVFDKSWKRLSPQGKFSQVSSLEKRIDAIDLTKRRSDRRHLQLPVFEVRNPIENWDLPRFRSSWRWARLAL